MLSAVLQAPDLRGLVLETFGAGNAPQGRQGAITQALKDAVSKGTVIVNVTQCLSGNVGPLYAPAVALERAGVTRGSDLTAEAALSKLAFLLSEPSSTDDSVARLMTLNLRGELTEMVETEFRHPEELEVAPNISAMTALKYALEEGDLELYRPLIGRKNDVGLSSADSEGNTALVSRIAFSCRKRC